MALRPTPTEPPGGAPAGRHSLTDGLALSAAVLLPALVATSRDIDWYDGPELALAAVTLGVAHPPAEPLHTLLGHCLATIFPAYFGVALASTLPACLCAIPAIALADALVPPPNKRLPRALRAAPVAAALWCPPVFETSTRVEVYALATLGVLSALALAARRRALLAGVALGLTACANPVFAIAAALGVCVALSSRRPSRDLPLAFAGGLLGLLPYAHLPLAARDPARFVWGEPSTLRALLDVLRARDFAANVGVHAEHLSTSARVLSAMLVPGAVAVLVAVAGWSLGSRTSRATALSGPVVALLMVATLLANAAHAHNPDLHGYLMPAVMIAGVGLAALASRASERGGRAAVLCALLPAAALAMDVPWLRARAGGVRAQRALTEALLREAPRDAIVVLSSDHTVFPALYLHEAEGARRDLVIVNVGFVSSAWYWRHLERLHPGLRVVLQPGLGRERRLARFLDANPSRPVVAESSELLARAGRRACEGAFLAHAAPACAGFDLRRRLEALVGAARDVEGDWIGERAVASRAAALAREARSRGNPWRAALTLSTLAPDLAPYASLLRPQPDVAARALAPIAAPPDEALISPAQARYELGRTLMEAGEARGVELLRQAADEGVAAAAEALAHR